MMGVEFDSNCTGRKVCSESLAVGREAFVEAVKAEPGSSGRYRRIHSNDDDIHSLKEPVAGYRVDFDPRKDAVKLE